MRLEDVNLPEYLKRRVHSHVRGVGSQGRLTGTQALEVYRWAARWTVSNLGTNPKVSVKNSVPRISTQVSNLLPLESLPRGFNQKTTPVQKLENQISKYARGGVQGRPVFCSPLPEGEVDGTPFKELIKGGKVRLRECVRVEGRGQEKPTRPGASLAQAWHSQALEALKGRMWRVRVMGMGV